MLTVRYERLDLEPGMLVLDLGCGAGRHTFESLKRGASVISADLDDAALKDVRGLVAAMRLEGEMTTETSGCVVADALDLPFPDATFDRVIAAETLEHIRPDTRAIGEIARVLKPGGVVAVTVPRWWPELINWGLSREYRTTPGGHVRVYRRSQLRERLRGAGLEITGSHHAHAFHTPYWWLRSMTGAARGDTFPVRAFHRFLVWDIERANPAARFVERALNPLAGKSFVVYARKA